MMDYRNVEIETEDKFKLSIINQARLQMGNNYFQSFYYYPDNEFVAASTATDLCEHNAAGLIIIQNITLKTSFWIYLSKLLPILVLKLQ